MAPHTRLLAVALALAFGPGEVRSTALRRDRRLRAVANATAFQSEVKDALGSVSGCGGDKQEQLDRIERRLLPIWRSLPKSGTGRIEGSMLRHMTHRYFAQKSALLLRGFEESRPVKKLAFGSADAASQSVPGYIESVLESKHAALHGFDLKDAVNMVSTLEQLVIDSDSTLLERVYETQGKSTSLALSHADLKEVLSDYMVHAIVGDDNDNLLTALEQRHLIPRYVPHWHELLGFVEGQIRAMEFQRQVAPRAGDRGGNAFTGAFSFDDARQIVIEITNSFASFWESDCQDIRGSLVEMDTHRTGRVPLSRFYTHGNSRFAESEKYLRELGALDETSTWTGPQVIIPNYVQAASNCIISGSHYLICCTNFCEGLHAEIEAAIGAPTAAPREILAAVGNMTAQTTMDDESTPELQGALTSQLEQIAGANEGKVSLHGRLFAQWLHYAFPRECPFPHKSGTIAIATPSRFGANTATKQEKEAYGAADEDVAMEQEVNKEELEWMSQWNSDEEFMHDSIASPRKPWKGRRFAGTGALLVAIAGLVGILGAGRKQLMGEPAGATKAHLV